MPFTKGHKINVGRKMSNEQKIKLSLILTGENNGQYGKPSWNSGKRCKQLAGINNGCWKGDNASYAAKHIWMKVNFGKANKCEDKYCENISKTYHWANISGLYKRVRKDWLMLCVKCHAKFDGRTKCQK